MHLRLSWKNKTSTSTKTQKPSNNHWPQFSPPKKWEFYHCVNLQIIYDAVQKILEVFRGLRYWITVNVFYSDTLREFLHESLSTSVFSLNFLSRKSKEKNKANFRWKTTCVDWPPSLTSSRCPSSSKIKRNSRPRRSFRITQMTSEVQEWKADRNTGNTRAYTHSLTKPITHTVTRLSFRENFLD